MQPLSVVLVTMAWLIIANVVAIIVSLTAACPAHSQQHCDNHSSNPERFHGTNCSAVNYNKSCCLPYAQCYAIEGECSCSPCCYKTGNCCEDVHCPNG